jgi:formylglycine-generating enzyme required for sulfatase activity
MEGLPSIKPDQLRRDPEPPTPKPERRASTELELHAIRPSQRRAGTEPECTAVTPGKPPKPRISTERELPQITARKDSADRSGERDTRTAIEGLPAVRPTQRAGYEESPELPSAQHQASAASASSIDLHAVRVPIGRWIVFTTLWAVIAAVAVMLSVYLRASDQRNRAPDTTAEPSVKLAIPAGKATMGLDEQTRAFILQTCNRVSDDPDKECEQDKLLAGEFPERVVELPAFSIDSKEVTQGQWAACVAAGKCQPLQTKDCAVYTVQGLQAGMRVPKSMEAPELPAICITRDQAAAYCAWAGGALPSHDQWERAARGPDQQLFPWGSTWDPLASNWGEQDLVRSSVSGKIDGFAWTAPPGSFPSGKSPDGAYDMAGNVAEWIGAEGAPTARGGSWASNPFELRTTRRHELKFDTRRADIGLRCAYPP